jgi:hypothetical protein
MPSKNSSLPPILSALGEKNKPGISLFDEWSCVNAKKQHGAMTSQKN